MILLAPAKAFDIFMCTYTRTHTQVAGKQNTNSRMFLLMEGHLGTLPV